MNLKSIVIMLMIFSSVMVTPLSYSAYGSSQSIKCPNNSFISNSNSSINENCNFPIAYANIKTDNGTSHAIGFNGTIQLKSSGIKSYQLKNMGSNIGTTFAKFNQGLYITLDTINQYLYISNNGNNTVSVYDPIGNKIISKGISVGSGPLGITFDPNNGYLYVANNNNDTISVINGTTNTIVGSPIVVGANPLESVFDPINGNIYVSNNGNNSVSVINGTTNTVIQTISGFDTPYGITFDPNNRCLYVGNNNNSTISVINGTTNTIVGSPIVLSVNSNPSEIAFDPNNGYVYVSDLGNAVSVIDGTTNTIVGSAISGFSNPGGIIFDPINGYLYVSNSGTNTVSVINGATNTNVKSITVGTDPYGIVYDSTTSYIYVINSVDNTMSILNTIDYVDLADVIQSINCSTGQFVNSYNNSTGLFGCNSPTNSSLSINSQTGPAFTITRQSGNTTIVNNTNNFVIGLGPNVLNTGGAAQTISKFFTASLLNAASFFADVTDNTKKLTFLLSGSNTGTTLTIRENQTTSQGLNIPNIRETETLAIKPQSNFTSPSNPATTTSTTGVMSNLFATFTPQVTGRALVTICGQMQSGTAGDGAKFDVRYGTSLIGEGSAIGNTVVGTTKGVISSTAAHLETACNTVQITGLTLGTKIFIQIGKYAVTGGTATFSNFNVSIMEF